MAQVKGDPKIICFSVLTVVLIFSQTESHVVQCKKQDFGPVSYEANTANAFICGLSLSNNFDVLATKKRKRGNKLHCVNVEKKSLSLLFINCLFI